MKTSYIYILTNKNHTVLYIGVTSDRFKRIYEHKNHLVDGFTKKYKVSKLVYYEQFSEIITAIQREKQIKKWNRSWKIDLIEKLNSEWKDLYDNLCG